MHSRRIEVMAFAALIVAIAALVFALGSGFSLSAQGGTGSSDQAEAEAQPQNTEAIAAITPTFNYQGTLRNADGSLVNGTKDITLKIYDQIAGGNVLHQETFSGVTVRDGIFNVVLGDAVAIQPTVFASGPRYLGVTVGSDPEMIPRQRLHPVPWALLADKAALADQATNASVAQLANTATTLVANASVNGLNVTGNASMSGDLSVNVIRDVGNATGQVSHQSYPTSLRRYVVEAQDGGNSPYSAAVDDGLLVQLCGDFDGCEITLGMRDYDKPNRGAGDMATIGPFVFTIAETRPNGQRYWDNRNQGGGNNAGWDGNNGVEHVLNAFDSCYFTDGRYLAGSGSDPGLGFSVLNWSGGYTATDMVCVLIIND
ncbi:MAG: hypothetical protein J5I90_02450 [Caldilineales bacterium]|nr:hypothetical protein [Caldilineales bacterium]